MPKKSLIKQLSPNNPIVIYKDSNNAPAISIRLENETLWLTQRQIAELFGVTKQAINQHINNIFSEGELDRESTIKFFLIVQNEGNREVSREIEHYNLDMIISVGYRVNSKNATKFRQWASKILKEYIIKGFVLDDERLKGQNEGYFDELLERLRDIRSSEAKIYAQVLKIYATAIDYDKDDERTIELFKTIQNKLHYSAHGHTASEVIFNRVDSDKPYLGLTNFKGKLPTKKESEIAKNYLNKDELESLNRIVSAYFEFAELAAMNRELKTMQEHLDKLNEFLRFSGRSVLDNAGSVSHTKAIEKARTQYNLYKQKTKEDIEIAFEKFTKKIEGKKNKWR